MRGNWMRAVAAASLASVGCTAAADDSGFTGGLTSSPTSAGVTTNADSGDGGSVTAGEATSMGDGGSGDSGTAGPTSGDDGDTTAGADDTTTGPSECGNNVSEGAETCDGTDFGGQSCADFGFTDGQLVCSSDCTVLTEACFACGDDTKQMSEACDGTDLDGATCASLGLGTGSVSCAADCSEIITDSCQALPSCGDGIRNGSEQCELTDYGGASCQTLGWDMGNLTCNANCTYNTSGCQYDPSGCKGMMEVCVFDPNNPRGDCCPPGVKGNVLGICDIIFCI